MYSERAVNIKKKIMLPVEVVLKLVEMKSQGQSLHHQLFLIHLMQLTIYPVTIKT